MAKKYAVLWASVAEDDLISIIKYIHADNPTAAKDNLRACSKSFISSIIQDFGIWKEKDTQVILTENNLNR